MPICRDTRTGARCGPVRIGVFRAEVREASTYAHHHPHLARFRCDGVGRCTGADPGHDRPDLQRRRRQHSVTDVASGPVRRRRRPVADRPNDVGRLHLRQRVGNGQHAPGVGRGERQPAPGPDRAGLRGAERGVLYRGGQRRRSRTAVPPHLAGPRVGRRSDEFRRDQPGHPSAGHRADERAQRGSLRHRHAAHRPIRGDLRPGPRSGRAQGGRYDRPGGVGLVAAAGAVPERRMVTPRPHPQRVQRRPGARRRAGHQLDRARVARVGRARRADTDHRSERAELPQDRAELRRRMGLRPQRPRQPADQRPRFDLGGDSGAAGSGPVARQRAVHRRREHTDVPAAHVQGDHGSRHRRILLTVRDPQHGEPVRHLPGGARADGPELPLRPFGVVVLVGRVERRRLHVRGRTVLRIARWPDVEQADRRDRPDHQRRRVLADRGGRRCVRLRQRGVPGLHGWQAAEQAGRRNRSRR